MRPREFGKSYGVPVEIKGSSTFLGPHDSIKVDGQEIPRVSGVDVQIKPGEEARVSIEVLAGSLDLAFPAAVDVTLVAYNPRFEIIEEPIAGGGRRFYLRELPHRADCPKAAKS